MNTDHQVNLLAQAQAARDAGDWLLLSQCLQQLIPSDKGKAKKAIEVTTAERSLLLNLAMEVLVSGDFHQRWDVAKLLPRLGTIAIDPLVEILTDLEADEELRWFAARLLGEFNEPAAIAALVTLLKTAESEELSAMAATALGQIGTPAIAVLTDLLAAADTRLLAVRSLSQIRRSETIAPLLSVVSDSQVAVRAAAIEALSSFHDARIPPVLLSALADLAAPVRREAVTGLGFRPDLEAELDLVNQLVPRLYDFNLEVCAAAAFTLGRLGTDAAAAGLFQVLISPHTPVSLQIETIRALGWIETVTSWNYLQQALQQLSSVAAWQEIVTVLGRTEQPELTALATEILCDLLKSSHPAIQNQQIKQAIALSLAQLSEIQALDCLIELLADPDAGVKLHAIAALKQLAPETAYQRLQQLRTTTALPPDLYQGIAIALQEW